MNVDRNDVGRVLFDGLKRRGIFWSYSKNLTFEELGEEALLEAVLKYGDFADIRSARNAFGLERLTQVWTDRLVDDKRFVPLNLFLARVVFSLDVESNYFKELSNGRREKLGLLARKHEGVVT